jgi:dihydroorotase-like cyclic amidohydrolase
LSAAYRVTEDSFRSRSANSWLLGANVKGRVRATVADGRLVYAA